jgi:diaminopimelate decarboxylase
MRRIKMNPTLIMNLDNVLLNCLTFKKITTRILKNKNVRSYYAVKANYLKEVRNLIFNEGYGGEILSEYELDLVDLTVPLIINGHVKSDLLLNKGLERNDAQIIVESINEIERLCCLYKLKNYKKPINIGIRLPYQSSRIGFNIGELYLLKKIIDCNNFLNIDMLHFHSGWNNRDDVIYREHLDFMLKYHNILKGYGIKITKWNVGGSFCEYSSDKSQLSRRIKMVNNIIPSDVSSIYLEPGRFLVGDAGILQANVIDVDNKGCTLDSATYGYLLSGASPCLVLIKNDINKTKTNINISAKSDYIISGIWPSENDMILVDKTDIFVGDQIVFNNMGAYLDGSMTNISFDFNFNYLIKKKLYDLWSLANEEEKNILVKFWDFESSLFKKIPRTQSVINSILSLMSKTIEKHRLYNEIELSEHLSSYFMDFATIRREMVENKFLVNDGGIFERK